MRFARRFGVEDESSMGDRKREFKMRTWEAESSNTGLHGKEKALAEAREGRLPSL